MYTLGISAFYHDSAATLLHNDKIIAAAQEERFTRLKHDASFPEKAIEYCLKEAGIRIDDVNCIAFYEKPFLKFRRLIQTYLAFAPEGFESFSTAMHLWFKERLFQKRIITQLLNKSSIEEIEKRLVFSEHHLSHAASAYYPSPYHEAVILTMDGVGEIATTSVAIGHNNKIEIFKEIKFPHSLGLLYSAFTYYLGFKINSGEYKVMGLAPYGEPKYLNKILDYIIDVKLDGSFRLNQKYFEYCTGLKMISSEFEKLFGQPKREKEGLLTQFHMDIAASLQEATNEIFSRITRSLARETGIRNLCLAGGVALNCVANGRVLREKTFENIWIQPAAGDAGGSLGAAYIGYHRRHAGPRHVAINQLDGMSGSLLGPNFVNSEIESRLNDIGARFKYFPTDKLINAIAKKLAEGKAIGWFQGRMEFGPRALGNRSILADPRSPAMQKLLNLKIKYRESFRPFAPSVLSEKSNQWFELNTASQYMLIVADIQPSRRRLMSKAEQSLFGIDKLNVPRSEIPAVTHVDYSARVQTVHKETNPKFYALIESFESLTGCPVLVNTSFNVRGEPIVCTPEDAFRCFMGSDLDFLAIGDYLLEKTEQNPDLITDYKNLFEPD